MDAALNRFVGTADSLAPEGWTKPQYILDAIKKKRKENRAFCPTGSGGGLDNSCGSGDGLLKSAVARWKGFTSEIDLHLKDEAGGKPSPPSASGSKMREQAKALLNEVIHNSTPAPTLYRGDDKPPSDNDSTLLGWTSSKTVAEKWAKTYGGAVYTLENATGLDLSRFGRLEDGTDDFQESEWIVLNNHPKKDSRAFCPTGSGGGVKNDCSSSDRGTGDIAAGDKSLASYEGFSSVGKTKNSDFISVPSDSDITTSLKSSQQEKVGAHRELPAGYPIDLRIDISAYENHDTYVVTAHEHVGGAGVGAPIGYDSIIRLKGDVSFRVGETAATKIGRGKTNKNTHSTVKGNFDPSREVPADIDSWTPVGYNPKTATYYYDKRTGKEVTGGVDSVSVGNTVFVRVPKYGNAKDPSKPPRNAKTDFRAFCPTGEGNGIRNDCGSNEKAAPDTGGGSGGQATAAKSSQFSESISDSNGKHDWEKGKGDPPFDGADKYAAVGISAPKQVAKSLDSVGVTPSQLLDMSGANAGGETVYVRPAPEFKNDQPFAGSGVIPLFVDYSRDIAGVKDGLSGSSVVGAKKSAITGETSLNIYHNMITVAESVRKDPAKRQTAAREFYRAMVSSVEAARKAGVTRVHLNAAGEKGNYYRGYTIWPRMGFDAPIPAHVAAKLPPELSHAKTLLDLHATREGTRWWADNGDDVDVSLDITDRSSPQNKLFDRFSKRFGTDSRSEYPGMPSLDGWLSEEDTAKIEGVWEEIWDSDLLDDYSGEEQNFDVDS
jgi:hypothetical protein